ncbi:MAG: carbamoyltransferase [Labilithrix sp.]|nr:carbamoyltransferase [Labilithrix sp.]
MNVLGICHDVLICSAALVRDGTVVSAVAEERLDRVKHSRVFPALAVQRCLEMGGLALSDIDEIAIAWNPGIDLETIPSGYLAARRWRTEHLSQVPGRFMQLLGTNATDEITITGSAQGCPPITFVNHYDAHVGKALFGSPFEQAAILVLDGRAEKQTSLLAVGRGTTVEKLTEVRFPHSLGLLYGTITQLLGFKPDGDEWKVMALASYASGDNEYYPLLKQLVSVSDDGSFELALDHFEFHNFFDRRMYSDKLVRKLGPARKKTEALTSRHEKLASAMQRVFEETVTAILERLHARTGLDQLVAAGGCFMNSVYNGKITEQTPFKDVYIGSAPDDSGTAVGAALWLDAQRTGKRSLEPIRDNYWGPEYTDAQCLDVVRRFKISSAEVVEDPSARAAKDLVDGKIIGWFQGRMEFGQRALGNRSILLDPRRKDGKDIVNAAIKFREAFRPFAPAILLEKTHEWFECAPGTKVPFMERVLQFRPEKRDLVPAVVHVDGSGRLQTVDRHSSPRYHALVEHFEKLTGVPIVLNTSFNLNGEPIVCSPDDALRTFYTCALEVLYLGNVRITK